ncbi:MAG: indole-3-glycerol-phosphate synthase [Candidatus Bathyarchaeota archaeon]|nr:indole-3-glycerol-phosphate synthase [Candidatus Bathyarchaeota archaeon]
MPDFLDTLAADAKATVASGYYTAPKKAVVCPASLSAAISECSKAPIIAEVKAASPSAGTIRKSLEPERLAQAMARAGAVGISVLTEPKHFQGSLSNLCRVREAVELPILMKDIIVSPLQLSAASRMGANVVLLIQALFDRGYCQETLSSMIADAHARKLEVLLETHNADEFSRAVTSNADLVGINNRDLGTLKVDLKVTQSILKRNQPVDANVKPVVSESGVLAAADVRFLRKCGAQAFLVGSAVMLADNVEAKVRELVNAYA